MTAATPAVRPVAYEVSREDDWLAAHRFDLDTALKLAREAAPHVTVNGRTVADALTRAEAAK